MAANSFGKALCLTTFGESHGPAIGAVLDGVPPNITLSEEDIQPFLDQRKPGQSRFTTQRQEDDQIKILSGVFEGKTTGTSIGLLIENQDQRSKDYGDIAEKFRPAHADYTYFKKYGIRDHRGGGRSSARETAMRVAAGAIARKILNHLLGDGFKIHGGLVQMGPYGIERARIDWANCTQNPFFCPDPIAAEIFAERLDKVRKAGNSYGAVIEVQAEGVPAGLGEPIYGKLDSDLAAALMSINAVKAIEIGDGLGVASLMGSENADEISMDEAGNVQFSANHAGGILGGISSGQPIIARFAVKPTSSILMPRKTINLKGENTEIITKGRHDPCVGIRAVPVGEAMLALVLADHLLRHRGQIGTI